MHNTIQNPILTGFNPDPSICRVGEDYYIATSTFEWFPGVQIHHSRDLRNWRMLTRPLNRLSQLDMKGNPDSCGVWAPNLTYNDGTFYLVYTDVKRFDGRWKDTHNYLVTSTRIDGEWSDPIYLNSSGFDPSLFHDDNGRAWVANLLVDHRRGKFFGGIILQEYSYQKQKLIGKVHSIFPGTALGITEAPVLFKQKEWYYLLTAEGGTEYGHAVTLARAQNITGPYEVHPENPLLTSANNPCLYLQKAGHASVVLTPGNRWYLTHLTGRPLSTRGRCTLGRETALQEIEWRNDGWPYLKGGGNEPKAEVEAPDLPSCNWIQPPARNDFDTTEMPIDFQSLRVPMDESWVSLTKRKGYLALKGRESLCSTHNQSMIARRQQHFQFVATARLEFHPHTFQQMAGLTYYYNTRHFYYLFFSWEESLDSYVLNLLVNDDNRWYEPLSAPIPIDKPEVWLRATVCREQLIFSYSVDGQVWNDIGGVLDASIISDDYVRDKAEYKAAFTGAFIGMCCQDVSGQNEWAYFDSFEYKPITTPTHSMI